jgi:hypothetical protein
MKRARFIDRHLVVWLAVCGGLAFAGSGAAAAQSAAGLGAGVTAAHGGLPIYFEANQGQTDRRVRFLSRGNGYQLFLTPDEAVLSYVIGSTASSDFPTVNPLQPAFAGGENDAFVVKISATGAGLSGSWQRVAQHCRHDDERGCIVQGVLGVHNPGTQTAATSFIRVFLSADEALDEGDQLVKEAVLRPLRAGRTRTKTVRVELDATAAGQFLIAVLDADGTVPRGRREQQRRRVPRHFVGNI